MKTITALSPTLKQRWGLFISLLVIFLLVWIRVNSHKYSFDTTTIFLVFRSILFDKDTLIFLEGLGEVNYLNIHFNLAYILLSPLYFIGPAALITIWKTSCYAGFLIVCWRLIDSDERAALTSFHKNLFILLVAIHPTFIANLIAPNIWDSDLILPLIALSIFYNKRHNYFRGLLFFCLTFLVKEDMMLVGIFYGILLVFHARNIKFIWLSIFSLIWFFIVTHIIMPSFAISGGKLTLLKFSFGDLGDNIGEVIISAITNPQLLIKNGFWLRKISSIIVLLACFGFLPLIGKRALIYLLPGLSVLGYSLIAAQPYLDYSKHYVLPLFAFLVWASYESYVVLDCKYRPRLVLFSSAASLFIVILVQLNMRAWHFYLTPTGNFDTLHKVTREFLPDNVSVLTGGVGSPWACYKRNCFVLDDFAPDEIEKNKYEYIIVNLRTIFWETLSCSDRLLSKNLKQLNQSKMYQAIHYADDIVLLKRYDIEATIKQPPWSERIDDYVEINHDCYKSELMRAARLF